MGNQISSPATSPTGAPTRTPEELQQRAERRKRIAQELCQTEQSYVGSLIAVVQMYILPLTESCKTSKPILPASDIKAIFSLWQNILEFQSKLFLSEFEARTKNWTPVTTIGDVFTRNGDLLRTYVLYVTNYDQSTELLVTLPKKNKQFEQFLQDVKRNPMHTQMDLGAYLIMPIQRIPRYVLLINDLIKYTEPNHPDFIPLQEALIKVQKIASDINETKREDENMRRVLAIQRSIDGTFEQPLVQPHRRLVRQGELTLSLAEISPSAAKNQATSPTTLSPTSSSSSFSLSNLFSMSSKPEEEDPSKPVKVGWLVKQGGGFKTWKKRFFVLNYHRLAYYEDEKSASLKGVFEIDATCKLLDDKQKQAINCDVNCIALETPGRVYIMKHEQLNKDETKEWERAIQKVIQSVIKQQKRTEDPKATLGLTIGKQYFCFLFNDMVVYTTAKPKNTYNLKGLVYFTSRFRVQRLETDLIQLENEQFLIRFKAKSPEEADGWATDIQRIVDEMIREEKVRQEVANSTTPSFWKSLSSFFSS